MSSVKNDLLHQSLKDRVEKQLRINSKSRNSDRELIAEIWIEECMDMAVWNVLDGLKDGRLSNPESIRRQRQMLQRDYPELRGQVDELRMRDADEIRKYVMS